MTSQISRLADCVADTYDLLVTRPDYLRVVGNLNSTSSMPVFPTKKTMGRNSQLDIMF